MMIRFSSEAGRNVTLQDRYAMPFIHLMGHSGRVPGALGAADVGAALQALKQGLSDGRMPGDEAAEDADDDERPVPASTRAYPLIQLLEAAERAETGVLWDYYDGAYI